MKIEYPSVSLLILLAILIILRAILQSSLLNHRLQPGTQEHKPKAPTPLIPKLKTVVHSAEEKRDHLSRNQEPVGLLGLGVKSGTDEGGRRRSPRRGVRVTIRSAFTIMSWTNAFTPWWGMAVMESRRGFRI
jgi:hypothetical protein